MSIIFIGASASWQTVFNPTLNTNDNGYTTYCLRQRLNSALFSPTLVGTKIKITVEAGSTAQLSITEMFIQEQAAAGDDWDYTTTPIRVTWDSGSNGFTNLATGTTKTSDEITFAFDTSKDYVIGSDMPGAGNVNMRSLATLAGAEGYRQVIDGDAATVDATGYTAHNDVMMIKKIEVFA